MITALPALEACALLSTGIALGWSICSHIQRIQEAHRDRNNQPKAPAGSAGPRWDVPSSEEWESDCRPANLARMVEEVSRGQVTNKAQGGLA